MCPGSGSGCGRQGITLRNVYIQATMTVHRIRPTLEAMSEDLSMEGMFTMPEGTQASALKYE